MSIAKKLVTQCVEKLTPYLSARRIFSGASHQGDWLNANESPYSNAYSVDDSHFNRYPDCQPQDVINNYASYADVKTTQVLVSRGADEGIELLIRAFCSPAKDAILICPPTYGMYAISANTFDVAVKTAPLTKDFQLDVEAIKSYRDDVKLVFICAPNNPTGTLPNKRDIEEIIQYYADSALVIIDEAYIEFSAQDNHLNLLKCYPNVVILRTLSKAFALAGIRCGFVLAEDDIIQTLLKVIAPYPVAAPVAQIATQALSTAGLSQCQSQVALLQQQQAWLAEQLSAIKDIEIVGGLKGNFILFRYPRKQVLMDTLVAKGILIRDQSKQMKLDNCLRISVGNPQQNQDFITAVETFTQTFEVL